MEPIKRESAFITASLTKKWGQNTKECFNALTGDSEVQKGKKQEKNTQERNKARIELLKQFVFKQFQESDQKQLSDYDVVGLVLYMLQQGDLGERGFFGSKKSALLGEMSKENKEKVNNCHAVIRAVAQIFAAQRSFGTDQLRVKSKQGGLANIYQGIEMELENAIRLLARNNQQKFDGVDRLIGLARTTLEKVHEKNKEIALERSRTSPSTTYEMQARTAKRFSSYLNEDENKSAADRMVFGRMLSDFKQELNVGNFAEKRLAEIEDFLEDHLNHYWYQDAFNQLQSVKFGSGFAVAFFHHKMKEIEPLMQDENVSKEVEEKESVTSLLNKTKLFSQLIELADPSVLQESDMKNLDRIKLEYSHLIEKTVNKFLKELNASSLLLNKGDWDQFNKQYKEISEYIHIYKIKAKSLLLLSFSAETNQQFSNIKVIKNKLSFLGNLHSLPRELESFPKDKMIPLLKCYRQCCHFKNQVLAANDPLSKEKFNREFLDHLDEVIENVDGSFNLRELIDYNLFDSQILDSIQKRLALGDKQRAEKEIHEKANSSIHELNLHMSEIESYLNVFPLDERSNSAEVGNRLSLILNNYKKLKVLHEVNTELKALVKTKDEKGFQQLARKILNDVLPMENGKLVFERTGNKEFDDFLFANFTGLHASISSLIGTQGWLKKAISPSEISPKVLLECGPELIKVVADLFYRREGEKYNQLMRIAKIKSIPDPDSPEFNTLSLNQEFFEVLKSAYEYAEQETKLKEQDRKLFGSKESFYNKDILDKAKRLKTIASEGICDLIVDPTAFQTLINRQHEEIPKALVQLNVLVKRFSQGEVKLERLALVHQFINRLEYVNQMYAINDEIREEAGKKSPDFSSLITKMPGIQQVLNGYELGFDRDPLPIDEHLNLNFKEVRVNKLEEVNQMLMNLDLNRMKKRKSDLRAAQFNLDNADEAGVKQAEKDLRILKETPSELDYFDSILKDLESHSDPDNPNPILEKNLNPQLMLFASYCRELFVRLDHICDCVEKLTGVNPNEIDIDVNFEINSEQLTHLLQAGKPLFSQLDLPSLELGSMVNRFYGDAKLKFKIAELETHFSSKLEKLLKSDQEDFEHDIGEVLEDVYDQLKKNRSNQSQPEEVTKQIEGILNSIISNMREIRKVALLHPSRFKPPVKTSITKIDEVMAQLFTRVDKAHQEFFKNHMAYNETRNKIAVLNDLIQKFSQAIPVEVYQKVSGDLQQLRQKLFTIDHILPRLKNPENPERLAHNEKIVNEWLASIKLGVDKVGELVKTRKGGMTRSLSISGKRQVFYFDSLAEKVFESMSRLERTVKEQNKSNTLQNYLEAYELYKEIVSDPSKKKNFIQGFPNLWEPFEEIVNKTTEQIYYNFSKPQTFMQIKIFSPAEPVAVKMDAWLENSDKEDAEIKLWNDDPNEALKLFFEEFNNAIQGHPDLSQVTKYKEIISKIFHRVKSTKVKEQLKVIYSNIVLYERNRIEKDLLKYDDPSRLSEEVEPSERLLFIINALKDEERINFNIEGIQDPGLKEFFARGMHDYAYMNARNELEFHQLFEAMLENKSGASNLSKSIVDYESLVRNSKPVIFSDLIKVYTLRFFNHYIKLVNEYERSLERLSNISDSQELSDLLTILSDQKRLIDKFEISLDTFIKTLSSQEDRSTQTVREILPIISKYVENFKEASSRVQEQVEVTADAAFHEETDKPFDMTNLKKLPAQFKRQVFQNLQSLEGALDQRKEEFVKGAGEIVKGARAHAKKVTRFVTSAADTVAGFGREVINKAEEVVRKGVEGAEEVVHKGKAATAKALHEFLINRLIANLDVPTAKELKGEARIDNDKLTSNLPALFFGLDESLEEFFGGAVGIEGLLKGESEEKESKVERDSEGVDKPKRLRERLSKDIDTIRIVHLRIKQEWPENSPRTSALLDGIIDQARYCSRFLTALRRKRPFSFTDADIKLVEGIDEKRKLDPNSLTNLEKLIMVFQEV